MKTSKSANRRQVQQKAENAAKGGEILRKPTGSSEDEKTRKI